MVCQNMVSRIPVLALLAMSAGCTSAPGYLGLGTEDVARRITVYYATDRAPTSQQPNQVTYGWKRAYLDGPDPYQLGVCKVEIRRERSHDKVPPLPRTKEELVRLISTSTLDRWEFYDRIRENMWNAGANETLVFVHGFNYEFSEAAQRTAELWYDLGFSGPPILYSWPSRGNLAGYFADAETIEWTAVHLKMFLEQLVEQTSATKLLAPEPARIHLVAHSMGCRALTQALALIAEDLQHAERPIFCDVVLAAPDIDRDVLRDVILPVVLEAPIAEHYTLYASSADMAIKASEALQVYPRAGNAAATFRFSSHGQFDTIDTSALSSGSFDLNHDYFISQPPVLRDLIEILVRGNHAPGSPQRALHQNLSAPGQPWIMAAASPEG